MSRFLNAHDQLYNSADAHKLVQQGHDPQLSTPNNSLGGDNDIPNNDIPKFDHDHELHLANVTKTLLTGNAEFTTEASTQAL